MLVFQQNSQKKIDFNEVVVPPENPQISFFFNDGVQEPDPIQFIKEKFIGAYGASLVWSLTGGELERPGYIYDAVQRNGQVFPDIAIPEKRRKDGNKFDNRKLIECKTNLSGNLVDMRYGQISSYLREHYACLEQGEDKAEVYIAFVRYKKAQKGSPKPETLEALLSSLVDRTKAIALVPQYVVLSSLLSGNYIRDKTHERALKRQTVTGLLKGDEEVVVSGLSELREQVAKRFETSSPVNLFDSLAYEPHSLGKGKTMSWNGEIHSLPNVPVHLYQDLKPEMYNAWLMRNFSQLYSLLHPHHRSNLRVNLVSSLSPYEQLKIQREELPLFATNSRNDLDLRRITQSQ